MPKSPRSPQADSLSPRRRETRSRLVQAAIKVVARDGFHAASVDSIARAAGYSVGAIYANFGGKDELFFAVFDEHTRWWEREVAKAAAAPDLAAAIERSAALLARDRSQFLIFIEFWAYAVRKPSLRTKFAVRMGEMRTVLAQALEERAASENGSLGMPAETLATLGLALGRGLTIERLADPDAVSDELIAQSWLRVLGAAR